MDTTSLANLRRPALRPAPGEILTPAETAAMLAITTRTLAMWAQRGAIPCFRTPGPLGHRRYRRADVDAFLNRDGGFR